MKRSQSGITLVGFIIVLGVAGVFIYMGMKVIPMYSEYYAVKQSLEGIAKEPNVVDETPARIKDMFFRRMNINYSENVKPADIKVVRKDAGYLITVDYEVRKPLIANLDVVGNFNAEKELRRGAADN
ncbi:MAG: DUF4845 domain-containing protein [Lysobacter sp.]